MRSEEYPSFTVNAWSTSQREHWRNKRRASRLLFRAARRSIRSSDRRYARQTKINYRSNYRYGRRAIPAIPAHARASIKPDAKSKSDSRDFSAPAPLFPAWPRVYLVDRLRPDRPDAKKIAAAQQFIPDRLRRNRRMIHERPAATSNPVGNQEPRLADRKRALARA